MGCVENEDCFEMHRLTTTEHFQASPPFECTIKARGAAVDQTRIISSQLSLENKVGPVP